MSARRHNSNVELFAQGVANILSPMVGGLPAQKFSAPLGTVPRPAGSALDLGAYGLPRTSDGGTADAGSTDGGSPADGGTADAGADAGGGPAPDGDPAGGITGSCASAPAGLPWLALAVLVLIRRSR